MTSARHISLCALLVAFGAVVACGGAGDESPFPDDPGEGGFSSGSSGSSGGASGGIAGSSGGSSGGTVGTNAECAKANAAATLKPATLVVLYDKSGSMGKPGEGDRSKKWDPVSLAMKDFFADATSKDLKASLDFFPQGQDVASICSDATYGSPQVSVRALPDAAFGQAIDAETPNGPTPTAYAMRGALGYAKGLASSAQDEKVILLLVTDGLPGVYSNGRTLCSPNTVDTAAAVAAGGLADSPAISTYVIGVADVANPDGLTNLDRIAQAGGTQKATIVQTDDPTKTKTDFAAALARVRGEAVSCDFAVPPPPDGKTIDFGAVNVTLTSSSGDDTLPYSKDCTEQKGWHYDDANAPKKIILCDAACTSAKAAEKIDIIFGCATRGGVVK